MSEIQNFYQIVVKYCVQYPVRAMVIFPPVMAAKSLLACQMYQKNTQFGDSLECILREGMASFVNVTA